MPQGLRDSLVMTSTVLFAALSAGGCYGTDGDGGGSGGAAGASHGGSPTAAGGSSAGQGSGGDAGGGGSGGSLTAGTGGLATAGSSSGGSGGAGGSEDPTCASADSNGFFSDCSACGEDCDTLDDGSGTRYACGCSSGCPCGLSCGCYEIAPNVGVCDICIR